MIKCELSQRGINETIGKLNFLNNQIEHARVQVVNKLVTEGMETATVYNDQAPQSGTQKSVVHAWWSDNGKEAHIALSGDSAVYDEFGTGEEGASNPHPLKSNFANLNPYNSGAYVSTHVNKNGRHYWFYKPMAGRPYFKSKSGYTEGIPAGKQMYNTSKFLRKIAPEVTRDILAKATKIK